MFWVAGGDDNWIIDDFKYSPRRVETFTRIKIILLKVQSSEMLNWELFS